MTFSSYCKESNRSMHEGTSFVISNLILNLFWVITANIVLENRYSKLLTIVLEFSIISFVYFILLERLFPIFSIIKLLIGSFLVGFLIHYFHTDKPAFKIITVILILFATAISDVTLQAMLPKEQILSGEIFRNNGTFVYSVYLFLNFIFLTAVALSLRRYKRKNIGLLENRQWVLFLLFPLSQLLSIYIWLPSYLYISEKTPSHIIFMICADIIADIALLYMFYRTASNAELRARSEMLEDQIKSQESYYNQLVSTYTDIRRMRHDIDNHLYTIRALVDSGNTKDAVEYADKVIEEDHIHILFPDCRNTVAASYLEKKIEDLKKIGITLNADIHLPANLDISNPDLICIYGNILDNAAEACSGTEHASIDLNTNYKQPYLTISCTNPAQNKADKKKRRFAGMDRGVGLTILAHLADQYDGELTAGMDQGVYHTSIILKTKEIANV